MKNDLTKMVLLSTALTNCTPWRISVKYPYEDEPNYKRNCNYNLPPQIEVFEKAKKILIYDPDNKLEVWGWDLDKKIVYATDECGQTTIRKFGEEEMLIRK